MILFVFGALIGGISGLYSASDDVVELTAANFNSKVINGDGVWLVEFYAPWCGHCKSLAPEWKKAAAALKGVVNVGAVDMDVHQSVGGPYNVRGFPTLKIFGINKNSPKDYNGARTAGPIVDAALKEATSYVKDRLSGRGGGSSGGSGGGSKSGGSGSVVELTDANFKKLVMDSNDMWLVEFFAPWCGHCQRLEPEWKKAAKELGGKVKLGAVDATAHTSIAGQYQIKGYPSIKYFAAGPKSNPVDYDGGRTASDIVAWALSKVVVHYEPPKIVELTGDSVFGEECREKTLCIISVLPHILDTGAEGRNNMIKLLKELGDKYKAKQWGWVWTSAAEHPKLESMCGIGGFGYPALVAVNLKKKVAVVHKGGFSDDSISETLRALSVGRGNPDIIRDSEDLKLATVEKWDGLDGQMPEEEDFSDLDDMELDDLEEIKTEL